MSGNPVGGAPPEMGMKTLTVKVVPNAPVARVRMKLAQNMTPTGGFGISNFEASATKARRSRRPTAGGLAGRKSAPT